MGSSKNGLKELDKRYLVDDWSLIIKEGSSAIFDDEIRWVSLVSEELEMLSVSEVDTLRKIKIRGQKKETKK